MSIINTADPSRIQSYAESVLGQSFRTAQDAWRAWLQSETSSTGSLYDLEMRYLGSQGRTGSLYDRWRQECIAAGYTQDFPEGINAWLDNPDTGIGGIDEYTKLMLHMDGADASTTFTDSSSSAKTVTPAGSAQIDTAQSVFGGASGLFDGNGDYLTAADSADWNFGNGDFTIDFRVRFAALPGSGVVYGFANQDSNGSNVSWALDYFNNSGTRLLRFYYSTNGTSYLGGYNYTWAASINTWYHIALVRSGTSVTYYIDGTAVGTPINIGTSTLFNSAATMYMAGYSYGTGNNSLNGWMDEVRISKGIARWASNFTPPTEAYSE